MFFNRADYDLASATPGTFALVPIDGMIDALKRDYEQTVAMIFGEPPKFDAILESLGSLETKINAAPK
jgi:hypothetical protein